MSVGTGGSVATGGGGIDVSVGTDDSVGTGVSVGTGGSGGIGVASLTSRRDSALGVARALDGVSIPSVPQAERSGIRIRIEIRKMNVRLSLQPPGVSIDPHPLSAQVSDQSAIEVFGQFDGQGGW